MTLKVRKERRVFVVHGRNGRARAMMFEFLRRLGLHPIEWSEAITMTKEGVPFVGRVLDRAFRQVQAVVVLLTGDDLANLRQPLLQETDGPYERVPTPQARPNVLLEAGMALGRHPQRTIISCLGEVRPLSDLAGRHLVLLDGEPSLRDLRTRLETAGCLCRPHKNWLNIDFRDALRDLPITKTEGLSVTWSHDDAPVAEKVIRDARHSLLLVGTSHYRVVTGDQRRYQRWLSDDYQRQLGILFLHPDSPHATARRSGLHRSNVSFRQACVTPSGRSW